MKKAKNIILAMLLISISGFAQTISSDEVPETIQEQFKSKFPAAKNVIWESEANGYEGSFKENGKETAVLFSEEGKWMMTETEIAVSEAPANVSSAVYSDFNGYKIAEANKVDHYTYGKCFKMEITNSKKMLDVYYSKDGTLLNKEEEDEGEPDED